ncbi:apolipoprotein N-acyltransferase, partial [Flavobacteriaceae bacterium]|nr:apolipoprotein N-acyltransferase [Flavobacteriaceae bacterium]
FFELIRSSEPIFGGFSLGLLGYIWGFSLYISQMAAFVGIYGLSFLAVFLCGLLGFLFESNSRQKVIIISIIFISVILLMGVFGWKRLKNADNFSTKKINIRIVQPNIDQSKMQDIGSLKEMFLENIELSKKDGLEKIDLLIWGESAVAFVLDKKNKNSLKNYIDFLPKNSFLITGAMLGEISDSKIISKVWNSMIFINDKGEIVDYYDKVKLVPFGEYVPLRKFLPFIKKITFGMLDFSRGEKSQLISLGKDLPNIISSICYETSYIFGVYPKKENSILINVTNDAWYGNSSGPYQNFEMAIFRAIENKLPVVRASNNGISGVIDAYGRVIEKTKLNERTVLDITM